eukprot:g5363.t1
MRGRTVVAVSGIGCPAGFADMLQHQLGVAYVDTQVSTFPDHHIITDSDVSMIQRRVEELSKTINGAHDEKPVLVVTTEKDFFRCANNGSSFVTKMQPLVVSTNVSFRYEKGSSDLARAIFDTVAAKPSSPSVATSNAAVLSPSPNIRTGKLTKKPSHKNCTRIQARAFCSDQAPLAAASDSVEFPFHHVPVLAEEVSQIWVPPPRFLTKEFSSEPCLMVDTTAGGGGHSKALLDAMADYPNVRVLCVDRDAEALQACAQRLADAEDRVFFAHGRFSSLLDILERPDIAEFLRSGAGDSVGLIGGVLADLGVSTYQLENPERGFSCMSDRQGPLDMRMTTLKSESSEHYFGASNVDENISAADLLNNLSEDQLTWIFREYGGISHKDALKSARSIVDRRPLSNTQELADAISRGNRESAPRDRRSSSLQRRLPNGKLQRYFQALRIATNGELEELDTLLSVVPPRLVDGGVFAVISFHSLEDARVKNVFRNLGKRSKEKDRQRERRRRLRKISGFGGEEDFFTLITRRAIKATVDEIQRNKPSRSARLRVLRKGRELIEKMKASKNRSKKM